MNTKILLADDHQILREGLINLLGKTTGYEIVGETDNGLEAVELARRHQPDVAILDLSMPRLNGLDAAREIIRLSPRTKNMLLTMHSDDHYVLNALRAGVKGYIVKQHSSESLQEAIKQVTQGRVYLSPGLSDRVVQTYRRNERSGDTLTPRERQVLQLVAEGYSTKRIAAILTLSTKTVESHRTRIMQKLEIHDTVRLVHYAIRTGLLQI